MKKTSITANAIVVGETKAYKFTDIVRLLGLKVRTERFTLKRLKIKGIVLKGKGRGTYLDDKDMAKWFSELKDLKSNDRKDAAVQTLLWNESKETTRKVKPHKVKARKSNPGKRLDPRMLQDTVSNMHQAIEDIRQDAMDQPIECEPKTKTIQKKSQITRNRIVRMVQRFCEYNEGNYRKTWVEIYKRFAKENSDLDSSVLWDDQCDTLDYIASIGKMTMLYNLTRTMLIDEQKVKI